MTCVRLRGRAQVETLAGQVRAAEVDSSASLAAMRAGIQRETGVLAEQQRFIILGAALARGEPAGAGSGAGTLLASRSYMQQKDRVAQHLLRLKFSEGAGARSFLALLQVVI